MSNSLEGMKSAISTIEQKESNHFNSQGMKSAISTIEQTESNHFNSVWWTSLAIER